MQASKALSSIRYIYSYGSQSDIKLLEALLRLDKLAIKVIRQSVNTKGWDHNRFLDASVELILSLEEKVKRRNNFTE